jgi:hypothetical protein
MNGREVGKSEVKRSVIPEMIELVEIEHKKFIRKPLHDLSKGESVFQDTPLIPLLIDGMFNLLIYVSDGGFRIMLRLISTSTSSSSV